MGSVSITAGYPEIRYPDNIDNLVHTSREVADMGEAMRKRRLQHKRSGLTKERQALKSVTCASGPYPLDIRGIPSLGFKLHYFTDGGLALQGGKSSRAWLIQVCLGPWPPSPNFVRGSNSDVDH